MLRQLLNGWQVAGITRYASGAPFRVAFTGAIADVKNAASLAWYGTDARLGGGPIGNSGAIAPVFTGDPRLGHTGVGEKILDVSRIAVPGLGESGPFQQPYYFRLPSRWNFDLSLFKSFTLGGTRRLQLRVGAFNLFNQAAPTLGDIDLDLQTECNALAFDVPDGAGGAHGCVRPDEGLLADEEHAGELREDQSRSTAIA